MKKIMSVLLLMSMIVYAEKLPQLGAKVGERDNKIEIRIVKISKNQEQEEKMKEIKHKIKKGETLFSIAKKYSSFFQIDGKNMAMQEVIKKILKDNKRIKNRDLIYVGDILIIKR